MIATTAAAIARSQPSAGTTRYASAASPQQPAINTSWARTVACGTAVPGSAAGRRGTTIRSAATWNAFARGPASAPAPTSSAMRGKTRGSRNTNPASRTTPIVASTPRSARASTASAGGGGVGDGLSDTAAHPNGGDSWHPGRLIWSVALPDACSMLYAACSGDDPRGKDQDDADPRGGV